METSLHLAAVPVSADTERPMEGKRMRLDYVDTLRDLASAQVLLSHSMLAFFSAQPRRPPFVRDTERLLCGLAHLLHQRRGVGRLYIFCSQWLRSHAALFRLAGDRRHASVQPFSAARAAGDRKLCFFREIVHFFGGKNITASAIPRTDWLADGWRP